MMEGVDVQSASAAAAGRKSPRLTALARLLLQGDMGQSSSSSYDFPSCRQEQDSRSNSVSNNLNSTSGTNGRQQHRATETGGGGAGGGHLPSTRFEQQAEQLLQQEQALQMDQILELLGLLLKQQHPSGEKETNLSLQQQQDYTSPLSAAAGTPEAQRQTKGNNRAASSSPANNTTTLQAATIATTATTTTRHWVNTDELSRGETDAFFSGSNSATDNAAARDLMLRRRGRDYSSSAVVTCADQQKRQQEKELMNLQTAAIVAAATPRDDSLHGPNSTFGLVDSKSGSHAYVEGGKQQQKKQLAPGNCNEWTGSSLQPLSRGVTPAATTPGLVTYRDAGSDSVCRSYNNSSGSACRAGGEQEEVKNAPSSSARIPFRHGTATTDSLSPHAGLRDARQLQRLQLQQQLIQQQQQHPGEQQQLLVQQHARQQQYPIVEQHHLLHSQPHGQCVHQQQQQQQQQPSGHRQFHELQQHEEQQLAEGQMQRSEVEGNILNDETHHILSKSLDVLMGDVNIHVLKDLLTRKTSNTVVGSGSGRDCRSNVETSYSSSTHVTPGDAASFDAALLSLLQQQQQQHRQQQQYPQQQSKEEAEMRTHCMTNLESGQRVMVQEKKQQHRKGGNEGDMTLFGSGHPPTPPAASVTTRGRSCSSKSADEDAQITRTGPRQQEHLRRLHQRQTLQEPERMQQQEAGGGFHTNTAACLSAHFERTSPCQPLRSPAKKITNEGVNTKRSAAAAEEAVSAGSSTNKRGGAAQRQQQQRGEKKRGRFVRPSREDNREQERQCSPVNARGSAGLGDGTTPYAAFSADTGIMTEREEQETYQEAARKARLCTAPSTRERSCSETSPSDESPHTSQVARAYLLKKNMCSTIGAAPAEATGLEYARIGRKSSAVMEERQEGFTSQQQPAGAAYSNELQQERGGDAVRGLTNINDRPSEENVRAPTEKRLEAKDLNDIDKQLGARTGQAGEVTPGATETVRALDSSIIPTCGGGRRRVHEPCELALAAARLEQQGHTFTPPFYLRTPPIGTSNAGSRCGGSTRENCKRSEGAAGAEGDAGIGEGARQGGTHELHAQGRTTASQQSEDEQREVKVEEEEEEEDDMEGESLTQQQLTLLKHIYAVLSQAEEYFSFKSALYQLQIKRHLKKCVSSLAAAAASNGASSDKDTSPHTAGGNKHNRSVVHCAGNSQSKAIRLFTSMPPIPINVVEQRALLSVRKHLQAGGGGALLCQGDGFAQLLMEELDELLTSLVNKLLLIIVVKFQTCFIHAPARAQLREFLVSFVFPGDMATQLFFRDHVQAVVHARIRHFRDSVGRTLRHQPPPSPPLPAASLPRSGTKRSNRAAAGSASSPTSRETEEEGDDEEERQKKQKVCEILADSGEGRDRISGRVGDTGAPGGRSLTCNDNRKLSPTPAGLALVTQNNRNANEMTSHSATARAGMQLERQGRQSTTSVNCSNAERKVSPASRSPRNKHIYRERSLSNNSDAKQVVAQYSASCSNENVRGGTPGNEAGRITRAVEQGSATVAANATAADAFAGAQRKGTDGGAGGPVLTSGCGSGINSRTRGRLHSRRKRGTATAASNGGETRSPSTSSSRYGPAAATRRGGGTPAAEKSSNRSTYQYGGPGNNQQQCAREAENTVRRGGGTAVAGARTASKEASGAFTLAQRNQGYATGSADKEMRDDDYSSSNGQKLEGQRGERMTQAGGALSDLYVGRTSPPFAARAQSFSQVMASSQRHSAFLQQQQQQLTQQQEQLAQQQQRCSTGKRGDTGSRWESPVSLDEKAECCDRGGGHGVFADGTTDLMGSRTSVLSRGSTRESAGDPLAWDQVEAAAQPKGSGSKRFQPSPMHLTQKASSCGDSLNAGGGGGIDVQTTKGAAGERTGSGETPRWTTSRGTTVEEDEATQALAAALGGALDPNNGDSAAAAAGEVWEWLALAAASKDDQQQEKFKQTLETLLNAWSVSGSHNETRNPRGSHKSDMAVNNSRSSSLGDSNDGTNTSDGWYNFAGGVFPSSRDKASRLSQAEEVNLDPFDTAGNNAMHFSGGGMRGKDASLPSPSSVKGPPSEASTSLPPHEERTPPAERSTAGSADSDATHSLVATENSTSRRGSTVCLLDGSLRTGRATAQGERGGTTAIRSTAAPVTGGRGGGGGAPGSLRIPLPSETNRTEGTVYQKEATSTLDNISHNSIADFLFTYCKDDVSACEIAAQLRHRETISAAASASTTMAPGTSDGGVQAEAYVESSMPEENLMSSFSFAPAEQITKNSTSNNIELPALLAEALSASHTGGNSLAFSLSSLLTSSSPLPS